MRNTSYWSLVLLYVCEQISYIWWCICENDYTKEGHCWRFWDKIRLDQKKSKKGCMHYLFFVLTLSLNVILVFYVLLVFRTLLSSWRAHRSHRVALRSFTVIRPALRSLKYVAVNRCLLSNGEGQKPANTLAVSLRSRSTSACLAWVLLYQKSVDPGCCSIKQTCLRCILFVDSYFGVSSILLHTKCMNEFTFYLLKGLWFQRACALLSSLSASIDLLSKYLKQFKSSIIEGKSASVS